MKKFLLFCFTIISMLININVINAKEITLNDIKETLENKYNISVKESEIDIIYDDIEAKFIYENNILSTTLTLEKDDILNVKYLDIFSDLNKTIAILKGYSKRDIELFIKNIYEGTKEKDGFEITKIDNGENKIINYQIDIDKFNIDLLYEEENAPKINIEEISETEIKMYFTGDIDDDKMIDLYRSSDGENYDYIASLNMKNNKTAYYIDRDLEENKTYYYKAVVTKSNNYSEVEEVTTKEKFIVDDSNYIDEVEENPTTGYLEVAGVLCLLAVAIISLINVINFKRKQFVSKI